jgi:hypothetical protein
LRSDVKKGRPTSIVFRLISVGATASSKSNDRRKENKTAFILLIPTVFVGEYPANAFNFTMTSDSLDDSKAVADAPVRASDECQQITIDARYAFDCLRDTLPTFWSAGTDFQSNTG